MNDAGSKRLNAKFQKVCIDKLIEMCPRLNQGDLERQYEEQMLYSAVETMQLDEGVSIQLYQKEEKTWQLNSSVNPQKAAEQWAEQFFLPEINEYTKFLIFGLGDGRAILELAEGKPKCEIFIYEPSVDVFFEAINRETCATLLQMQNVMIFVEQINEEYFFHTLQGTLDYSNIQLLKLGVLPNYERIFADSYQQFRENIESALELVIYTKNTEIERMEEITMNMLALTEDIIKQYSVKQLYGCVERMGWKDVPAILIAAGPSLDKNIAELKKWKDRAFFLAVDTALNTLLENDIIPDIMISVDSRKPIELFENPKLKDVPIVFSQQSNQKLLTINQGMHFYEIDMESYLSRIFLEETGKETVQLPSGGSVANNGLSLLVGMGFQTILLVGQDLAYPNMQHHTWNAYKGKENVIEPKEGYIQVEDVQGKMVYTQKNMNLYRKWTERYISGYKEITFINTSDCGARIHGAKECTLEECRKYKAKESVDVSKLWKTMPTYFTVSEQQRLHTRRTEIPLRMDEMQKLTEKGLNGYQKLEQYLEAKEYGRIKEELQQVLELTSEIESKAESVLIRAYVIRQQYEVNETIYQYSEEDDVEKQVRDMIENGKKLMKAYREGIDKFKSR